MARQLDWLCDLQRANQNVPVLCAGDVFDKWNSPPELINFAIQYLPFMHAIAGQHDMPHHNKSDLYKSAYWTLLEAGRLVDVNSEGMQIMVPNYQMRIFGYPWESDLNVPVVGNCYSVALVHRYVWKKGYSYEGAPKTHQLKRYTPFHRKFDAVIYGDNHKGFLEGNVLNCGTFYRRTIDERNYTPAVGVLTLHEGALDIHRVELPFDDAFVEREEEHEAKAFNVDVFVKRLRLVQEHHINFKDQILTLMKTTKIGRDIRQLILEILEDE